MVEFRVCAKAKKSGKRLDGYVESVSANELSWCSTLSLIENSCDSVFPFLYEELAHDLSALVEDLCAFLNTKPPANLQAILNVRENPSPRSRPGRLLSQLIDWLSKLLAKVANPTVNRVGIAKRLRQFGGVLGSKLDRYFPAASPLVIDRETSKMLRKDWDDFLDLVGRRRGRDFSALSRNQS